MRPSPRRTRHLSLALFLFLLAALLFLWSPFSISGLLSSPYKPHSSVSTLISAYKSRQQEAAPAPVSTLPLPLPAAHPNTAPFFAGGSVHSVSLPARRPPAQLLEGVCPDPLAHEPRDTETQGVLGPCNCPLQQPPLDGWAFDCEANDWRILQDLAPWHDITITHHMLDAAFSLSTANLPPGYHFSISQGVVRGKQHPDVPISVFHDRLLDMLQTVSRLVQLPDCEFVLHAWDHAKVPRQDPIPVFSFLRDASRNDITVPYPYIWSTSTHDLDLARDANCSSSLAGRPGRRVAWRGSCTGPTLGYQPPFLPAYLRVRATLLSRAHPQVLDASLVEECVGEGESGVRLAAAPLDLVAGACQHRHLLLLDGNSASGRSSALAHAGAVLLKPDSVFSEWWYHLLRPWVHYVPVREQLQDLVQQAQWVVQQAPEGTAQCLADNLGRLAAQHIRREAIACYWWRLLSAWARLQRGGGRTEGFFPLQPE